MICIVILYIYITIVDIYIHIYTYTMYIYIYANLISLSGPVREERTTCLHELGPVMGPVAHAVPKVRVW